MAPTILVAGSTGNTGTGVTETLSKLITSSRFSDHRILATTRSSKGDVAQRLAKLPGVEVAEISWTEITPEWLREQQVVRAFLACSPNPSQFAEESTFYVAALEAGIDYLVRISTTACNVRPDCKAYYPRNHWALEALLGSPEFSKLKWSSLQPNVFFPYTMGDAVELVKKVRSGGEQQGTLKLMLAKDVPVGVVDASDVGAFAGRLLLEDDVTRHNGAKYVLNGPEDFSGAKLVKLIEEYIGAPVKDVSFGDMSWVDDAAAHTTLSKNIIRSLRHASDTTWEGKASASTTSKTVLEMSPPKITAAQVFRNLLESA